MDHYSIGTNVIVQGCEKELNQLRKIAVPNSQDVSWDFWKSQMLNGVKVVACFDDTKSIVIGIAMILPNSTTDASPKEAIVKNIAVLPNYPAFVQRALFHAALTEAKKCNLVLTSKEEAFPTLEGDLHKQCKTLTEQCLKLLDAENIILQTQLNTYVTDLIIGIGVDSKKLDGLLQEIEIILPYDPDFKYRFKQALLGLNDYIKNQKACSKS